MYEKNRRSLFKAVSYRITGTITTILISLLVSGKVVTALSIGLLDVFIKLAVYYLHERAWNRISFGKSEQKDPEYVI